MEIDLSKQSPEYALGWLMRIVDPTNQFIEKVGFHTETGRIQYVMTKGDIGKEIKEYLETHVS